MMVQCLMLISNCALIVELLSPSRCVFVYFILHRHFTLVNYVHRYSLCESLMKLIHHRHWLHLSPAIASVARALCDASFWLGPGTYHFDDTYRFGICYSIGIASMTGNLITSCCLCHYEACYLLCVTRKVSFSHYLTFEMISLVMGLE
jgi:hypothetical protein